MALTTLQQACVTRIEEVIQIAEKQLNITIKMPKIMFNVRGKRGGTASSDWDINLNNGMLLQEGDAFVGRTPGHEMAHLISYKIYGTMAHDRYWKGIMRLIGQAPERCHTFDTTNLAVRKTRDYSWVCKTCGKVMTLKANRHKKMLNGLATYSPIDGRCDRHTGFEHVPGGTKMKMAADTNK